MPRHIQVESRKTKQKKQDRRPQDKTNDDSGQARCDASSINEGALTRSAPDHLPGTQPSLCSSSLVVGGFFTFV